MAGRLDENNYERTIVSNYKVIAYEVGQIVLEVEGVQRAFPLPVVDGLYPEGDALSHLLSAYADSEVAGRVSVTAPANEHIIKALISPKTKLEEEADIRKKRNVLLLQTDWTQVSDSRLSGELVSAFAVYRQELRDVLNNFKHGEKISWPTPPFAIVTPLGAKLTDERGTPSPRIGGRI